MIEDLDAVIDSEFNNAGELLGLGALDSDVMGELSRMTPLKRAAMINRLTKQVRGSRRSRGEMEKFFKQVPKHVKSELVRGKLRLADYTIFATKRVTSKTIKMFETQDDKNVGVSNISNAKLPKNSVFLVSGIYLLAGISADIADAEANKAIPFASISAYPALANGEFSLKANKTQIVPENQANRRFVTDNDTTTPIGYYKLDNPRLIKDEELIEFTVEVGTMFGLDPDLHIWVGLDGTGTTP